MIYTVHIISNGKLGQTRPPPKKMIFENGSIAAPRPQSKVAIRQKKTT